MRSFLCFHCDYSSFVLASNQTIKGPTSRKWGLLMEWVWHVIFDQPRNMASR